MRYISRAAVAVGTFALSGACFLLVPTGAAADSAPAGTTKAGIEHAERIASDGAGLSKAQIEQRERATATDAGPARPAPVGEPARGDKGAAASQLALSATLGAALTGVVVLAARQVNQHRHAIAA